MAKEPSLYPTALDTEFVTDRASGDTITSSAYDILESAVSAIEVKLGVDFSGTNTISASKLSGASIYATTVTATTVSGTSLSSTNVYATTVTATNITAATLCSTNITATGVIAVADGTLANPSITFASQTNLGIYKLAENYLSIVVGGYANNFIGSGLQLGHPTIAQLVFGPDITSPTLARKNSTGTLKLLCSSFTLSGLSADATSTLYTETLSSTNLYATTVTAATVSANVYQGLGYLTPTAVTDTSVTMSANNTYVANNAGIVSATLPASAGVGAVIEIVGYGAGMWRIIQQAGQTIHFGNVDSTTGATGYLSATLAHDCVRLMCVATSTDYVVVGSMGNIVVV